MPRGGRSARRIGRGAAAGALLVAAIGLLSACGGQSRGPSEQVAAYLRAVNRIEAGLAAPLGSVTAASAGVAATTRHPASAGRRARREVRDLRAAGFKIRAASARLAALRTPAAARTLRRLLVALADQESRLTEQTARLIAFLPAFSRDLAPLAPATLGLERVLAVNQAYGSAAVQAVYSRKAAALRTFSSSVSRIIARLTRLRPPAVSAPGFQAQLRSLRGMRTASGQLASALAGGQTSGLGALLTRFDRAAAASSTAAVHRAQRTAIRRYQRQVADLSTLTSQAERERQRLAATLQ